MLIFVEDLAGFRVDWLRNFRLLFYKEVKAESIFSKSRLYATFRKPGNDNPNL
jgi:hypothetical protein